MLYDKIHKEEGRRAKERQDASMRHSKKYRRWLSLRTIKIMSLENRIQALSKEREELKAQTFEEWDNGKR